MSVSEIFYSPRIKSRGFNPSPVARSGIPSYADSQSFPKVYGTSAHEDWWNEQIGYCINGYNTGGVHIPGRYYYYLNFCKISTIKRGNHFPEYVDMDLEFFETVEEAKRTHKGVIGLKGRRLGVSEKVSKGVMDYGYRFTPEGYTAGICAGLQEYSDSFFKKFKFCNTNLPPELKVHELRSDDGEVVAGWKERTGTGIQDKGSKNTTWCRTMFNNPNVWKGEKLDDCIFEEAIQFTQLLKGYSATKKCFYVGNEMVGTPFIYGAGGKLKLASDDFKTMWHDADQYELIKMPMYGGRLKVGFFVGSKDADGNIKEDCPNVFRIQKEQNLSYEQVLGCEDVQRVTEVVLDYRKFTAKGNNKELYYESFLDDPLNEGEAFLRFSGNDFDTECLAEQAFKIAGSELPPYKTYFLDWEKDKDGVQTKNVIVTIPNDAEIKKDEEQRTGKAVYMRYTPDQFKNYKNVAVAGIDSYDQDKSKTSKSLGGMCVVLRRGHPLRAENGESLGHKRIPVVLIRNRPPRKEIFYDNCLKVAVLWNLRDNCMIDAAKPAIAQYFKDRGGEKYLSPRPLSFESESSQQTHQYGMLLTHGSKSKNQMLSILQTWVLDDSDECWFEQVIRELQDYDVMQKDSDWDAADALGLALVRDVDMKGKTKRKTDQEEKEDPYELPIWVERNGVMTDIARYNEKDLEDIKDPFLRRLEAGEYG